MSVKGNESRVDLLIRWLTILGYKESLRALKFVMKEMVYEKGHFREGDGTHYYYHIVDVMQILLNYGVRDEITLTAAALHDTEEDVEWVTNAWIFQHYGIEVAKIVSLVTKKPGVNYKGSNSAWRAELNEILTNLPATLIKTADRMHNFSTLRGCDADKKYRKAIETEVYFVPFFKAARKKYVEFETFFFAAKSMIEPHLWEIKEHYEEARKVIFFVREYSKGQLHYDCIDPLHHQVEQGVLSVSEETPLHQVEAIDKYMKERQIPVLYVTGKVPDESTLATYFDNQESHYVPQRHLIVS